MNLSSLDLSNILGLKNQRYDGLKALGKAIGRSSGGVLEELRIASNNLHASAICWLGNALVSCTLRVFDVSDNSIGDDSIFSFILEILPLKQHVFH
ncbi:hypothetical protein ScalyP_jg11350 [Parmales sp. scaly parma]|nr:hypothetical protein ScalyP_jg11350 [Parmales sp. scaly parma]